MSTSSDAAGTPRLSSIVQDELLLGVVRHFEARTGVRAWFQDASGYTIAPETNVPVYCSILQNHGRCGLSNPAVEMPPDATVPNFLSCLGGIGHLVIPIRRTTGGRMVEVGRLVSEPMAIRETDFSALLGESRALHTHPDNLSTAATGLPRVDPRELAELSRLLALSLERAAADRAGRLQTVAVAEAFEEVGLHGDHELIRAQLAELVRDYSDAAGAILSTHPGDLDQLTHEASFTPGVPDAEQALVLRFTTEVIRWISQTGHPMTFPDLGSSAWRRHVLDGADLEGSLVSVPVKLPHDLRGWWTAYFRIPMPQMEDQLSRLSVLAAQSAQTLAFVAQLEASEEAAMTDALTGLANRRYLHDQLERELSRSSRNRTPISMIMLDIDDFKAVNDSHGHRVGDDALKLVAGALTEPLRRSSTVCRYGGDEFCVIIPECGTDEARGVAHRLREEVANRTVVLPGSVRLRLQVSAGVATLDPDQPEGVDLIELADRALLMAKREGKNRVLVSA